ncbi:MAG TPA: aldo/keto reductase [Thermoanaerobaculia bacterium]|nr:aldo/keto reductase [Thermoanaerobaculia bacterium]
MRQRTFGPTGRQVPVIGQGTWNMERDDRALAIAALRRGLDLGSTHVDTAELYGDGEVEELVGEALAGRRHEVFLVSKVVPDNASRRGTIAACDRSLARLRTDHLDLYLLHWPGSHPLADTLAAFAELERAGKILAWGLSNFDERDLAAAAAIAGEAGYGQVACDQLLYHLGERSIEHAAIPACEERGIAVVAYSPFGSGHFPRRESRGGRVLAEIAAAHGVTPRQVALAFLLRRPSLFTIPKASRPEHVEENVAAADLVLAEDEARRIELAFPRGRRRSGVPIL